MKRVSCSFMHSPHQPWKWMFQIGPHWRKPQIKVRIWVQWVISLQIPNTWIQFETWLNYNYSLSWKELSCYSPTGPQMGILPTFTPSFPPKCPPSSRWLCHSSPTRSLDRWKRRSSPSSSSGPSRQFWMTSLVTFWKRRLRQIIRCLLIGTMCIYIYMYTYIHIYIYVYIICICIYIYICIYYMYIYVYIYICIYIIYLFIYSY